MPNASEERLDAEPIKRAAKRLMTLWVIHRQADQRMKITHFKKDVRARRQAQRKGVELEQARYSAARDVMADLLDKPSGEVSQDVDATIEAVGPYPNVGGQGWPLPWIDATSAHLAALWTGKVSALRAPTD